MDVERHFPMLDPPPDGLEQLQRRINRRAWAKHLIPATAVVGILAFVVLWHGHTEDQEESHLKNELRQIVEQSRRSPLAIDGDQPERVLLNTDELIVYLVD